MRNGADALEADMRITMSRVHRFASAHLFVAMTVGVHGIAWSGMQTETGAPAGPMNVHAPRPAAVESFGKLPLAFEANQGQTDGDVQFLARGAGYNLFLTSTEAVLSLRAPSMRSSADGPPLPDAPPSDGDSHATAVVRMRLLGAHPGGTAIGRDRLPGKVSYFRGSTPASWRTGISTYASVFYPQVYPGVDLVYYGNQGRVEHDFIVGPGVDTDQIRLQFAGIESIEIDASGDLLLATASGPLRLRSPDLYQESSSSRQVIDGGYVLRGDHTVGFRVGTYDRSRPLVIDPILIYSTFLGGTAYDDAVDIAIDAAGQAHVTGQTLSIDFPTAGLVDLTPNGGYDAFVTKLDAAGTTALYSTYLGGTNDDGGLSIAVDALGNAYVGGQTRSTNFPLTVGAADDVCGDCAPFPFPNDAFITKFDATGAIVYSTLLGGHSYEGAYGIAVDGDGNAYVTGGIANGPSSCNFPIVNGYDNCANSYYDTFITKLNATGTAFLYSTTLGGTNDDYCGCDIAVDANGDVVMTGPSRSMDFPTTPGALDGVCGTSFSQHVGIFDAIAVKIDTDASGAASLVYSTCVGGGLDDSGSGIVIDGTGKIWLTGGTSSSDFPTANAADGSANGGGGDAFLVQLDPTVSGPGQLLYGTYLGGSGGDSGTELALDGAGNVWVGGYTASTDFPTQSHLQAHQGGNDAFVTTLNVALSGSSQILFSTYLGGCEGDVLTGIVLDPLDNAYICGYTSSSMFPTTLGAAQDTYGGDTDAFVAKISGSGPAAKIPGCVTTATMLSMFEVRPTAEGLEVRWQFSEPEAIAEVQLERSERSSGPWIPAALDLRREGNVTVALDRGVEQGRTYYYRLIVRTHDGRSLTFGPMMGTENAVTDFAMRLTPNPSRGATQVEFTVPRESRIRISVVDVHGREVALLAEGNQRAGRYRAVWDGSTARGRAAPGLYFVRYQTDGKDYTQRLVFAP